MSRRRSNVRQYSAEDQALTAISKEAESRLAAKRAARAEAREIRMKEIERQQKEVEEKEKLNNDHSDTITRTRQQITTAAPGPRRGSDESSEGAGDSLSSKDRDLRMELRALEDKYKAAMMSSAQLDNEKQSLVYQVELLKDQLEEQAETHTELQREVKDKNRDLELTKRELQAARLELKALREQSDYKDRLIEESGLVIVAAENGELALERSKEAPSANGPIGMGGLLLSSEALDLLNKSGEGSLGTHTLASSPPASHITHPTPSTGTSIPLPSQPASEAPESESHIHSTTTESASLSEGLDGSSVDGPVLEDSSCVDGPNVVGASSVVAGGGEGGTGADAVHALNSAPSGRSVLHSPGEENGQNSPEQVDVNPSVSAEGEDAGSSSQPESDVGKNSGVENAGPAVVGHGVQGNESMEESVLVGMLTSSHDQDSSACKDGGQEGSELAGESELVVELEPCPGDEKPADSFPTATQSSLPGGGSDFPSIVLSECSHSQQVSCQDSEDDVDEFFDAVSTPLPSPLDTSTEFEVVGKSTGEGTTFGVSDATSLDAAGLNIGDTSFVVAGVTTGETCDVDSGTGKDDYSGEVDVRKEKEEGDGFFDAVVVESKGEEKTEADIGEGKKEGDMGFDAEGVEAKDEEKTEKDMGEGKGEGDGAFDDEGPGLKGEEKTDIDIGGGKAVDGRGFDDEGPGLKGGEKTEVDVEEGKGEGDRGFDDEGPGLKGGGKTEVDVEEGKEEGDRGFDDEGPGLKGGEKTEVDVEEGKGEGDRGFDDEGPGLKGGEKTEVDVEEGKGEGDRGFDDEGPGLKGGEKTEVDVEEGKEEGDRGFDDEGPGLKGGEKTEVDVEKGKGEGPGLKGGEKTEVDVEEGKEEGDRGFDDEGPGLKGGEKTEVDVEEGKGEGDRGFDDEGPGLKGGEKTEVDMEEGKEEGDRGFDDEGPGLKGGEKTEVDVEKGKGEGPGLKGGEKTEVDVEEGKEEGDRGFDDEGPGLKGGEKTEVDVEEGKGEGDRSFDDEGVETKGEEKTEGDNRVDLEENLTEGSTKVLGSEEKEGDADAESLTEEGTKNQSPSETADSGEGVDGEDKDENVTKTDVGVMPVVVEGMGAEGLQAQNSQHITDTRLGDGSSVTANRDSVDFPSEIMDEDSAGVSGAQRVGEVAVRVSMSDESNDVVGTDVCEGKESVTVSSESGEHGSEEPVAGVVVEGQLQDVADKKVASQVVDETDHVAAALNEQTGSDDTQNLSAFSAEVDDASPVSAPKIGSDDEQSTSKSAPVTLVSATALDQQQLVMSASEADSEAGHSGDEAMDVFEHDGEARRSVSGESCQQAPEEKEAEAEPQEPASEVPSESDSRKCQEESDSSKQSQGAESLECQGKKDAGVSEESEELPDTLSPLLDARKTLNRDLSEGATSEDSEAILDNEEYDFDDIDEVLADGSPVACKGKGGEQDLDDMSAEAAAEDSVSFGSRDSGLQDSICNRENEASQGDAASFGSRDSGLQESAPSKESEASKEDSASVQSRDSGSVVEDASPFPGKDSTTGAGAGAEGGAEGGTPGVKGSMESLDLEAKLDKMVSDDSGAKKTPAKEKHKQKKSTKFKRFKNIFK